MAVFFILWCRLTAQQKIEQNPELRNVVDLAFAVGTIMTLSLTANSLAFLKSIFIEWQAEIQTEILARDGHFSENRVTRLHLLVDQLNLFIGTGYLLWMIRDVISRADFKTGALQKLDELRVLDEMLKRPVVHYWWIIGGMVLFFGASSGKGMIMFLAIELTIM